VDFQDQNRIGEQIANKRHPSVGNRLGICGNLKTTFIRSRGET
jgi:hypothetical protein